MVLFLLLSASPVFAQSAASDTPSAASDAPSAASDEFAPFIAPATGISPGKQNFQWKKAFAEALFGIAIAHTYRATTQPETRAAIQGPFWAEYADSIQNLHGWNDSAGVFTSYVLHPMEGGFAAFVERQNDPEYRDVEFGKSQRYWISTMRSLAFSAAYTVAWSASPLGEPGIGNVQLHNKPGLVALINTESSGYFWMVAEDAIDHSLIRRFEQHVRNPYARALVRSTLNPVRSYANILALQTPWHRNSRPGVFEYSAVPKKPDGPRFRADAWPESTAFELLAEPIFERFGGSKGSSCFGGGVEGAVKSRVGAIVFHLDGCGLSGSGRDQSWDALNYLVGLRHRFETGTKWTPFFQVLTGGTKIAHTTANPEKKQQLISESPEEEPEYASYHTEVDTNGFTAIASAGLTYHQNNLLSWRVASVDYQRSWMLEQLDGFDYNRGLRISTGLAVTFGDWKRQSSAPVK
jgi:hypothetical protein